MATNVQEVERGRKYRLWHTDSGGRRRSKQVPADGIKHAEQLRREWVASMADETPPERSELSVRALIDAFLEGHGAELAPKTVTRYRTAQAQLAEILDVGAVELAPTDIVRVERAIASSRSASSARYAHALLRGAYGWGVVHGLVRTSPVVAVRPPTLRRAQVIIPETPIVHALIAAAKASDPTLGIAVQLLGATGMRRSEVVGLKWTDLLRGSTLMIERTIDESGVGWREREPKTKRSVRAIALDPDTLGALAAHRAWQDGFRAQELSAGPSEWIVGDVAGWGPWLPGRLSSTWERLRSGVDGAESVTLHQLRHWHVTMLLLAGIPVAEVARRVGHSSPRLTLDTYSHAIAASDHASATAIAAALSGK